MTGNNAYGDWSMIQPKNYKPQGRWPANLIHDGSDEVVGLFPVTKSSPRTVCNRRTNSNHEYGFKSDAYSPHNDSGSAARFFYCAKASRQDRNDGLQDQPEKPLLWSSGSKNPGSFQAAGTKRAAQNNHPTVKPTPLMRYLCKLVTPPGGIILDPFMGSGSTGKAALLEGFEFIGIELEKEYAEIAQRRIDAIQPLLAMG